MPAGASPLAHLVELAALLLLVAACQGSAETARDATASDTPPARGNPPPHESLPAPDSAEPEGGANPVRAAQLEAARDEGYHYWAIGNEPGWTLRLGPAGGVWTTDYGETVHEIPAAEPVTEADALTYRWETDGTALTISVVDEPCADDMSGERFSMRFVVELGERVYRGCGEPLLSSP